MLGFFHWISPFRNLQPSRWPFQKFCPNIIIKLWTQRYVPGITDSKNVPSTESSIGSCAAEYRKLTELVQSMHSSKLLFMAIDAVTRDSDDLILQLGLSLWDPRKMLKPLTFQWHVRNPCLKSISNSSSDSPNDHVNEEFEIFAPDLEELLRRQLSQYTSRNYEIVITGYNIEARLGRIADKMKFPEDIRILDMRKIWCHEHPDQEDATLENCIEELCLPCNYSKQPSAGNNAYHIIQILIASQTDTRNRAL